MKLLPQSASFSPIVVCEFGTGFLCARTRELRKTFGVHVSPPPRVVREATVEEARDFFRGRIAINRELGAYYDHATATGKNSGD